MSPAFTILAVILALVGAATAWAFVAVYSRPPFHWTVYEAGRHLMRFTFGIALILTWSALALVARLVIPEAEWLDEVVSVGRLMIFGYVTVMMASRLRILLRARNEPPPEGDSRRVPINQQRTN